MHESVTIKNILEEKDNDTRLYRDIMMWGLYRNVTQLDLWEALGERIKNSKSEVERDKLLKESETIEEKGIDDSLLSFRFTELGNWLVEKHLPFVNEYSDSHLAKSYRLHAKRNYIQSRIGTLIELGLISSIGTVKSKKNKTDTPKYHFTVAGQFLGCLIEARNKNKPATEEEEHVHVRASQELFDSLDFKLEENADSLSLFLLKFFANCKEKDGMFDKLIDEWAASIFSFFFDTESDRLWLRQTLLTLPVLAPDVGKIFLDTLMELDEQLQRLFLFQLKLDFESDYSELGHYWGFEIQKMWELMRFQNIQNYSKLTLLGFCDDGCNSVYPFQYDILKFIQIPNLFKAKEVQGSEQLKATGVKIDCLQCGRPNSLKILRSWSVRTAWVDKEENKDVKLQVIGETS